MTMEEIDRRIAALPVTTFAVAAVEWQKHECDSDSDVCGCKFQFKCTQCGANQTTFGESMPELIGIGGLCEGCLYDIKPQRKGEYLIPAGARDGACRSCGAPVLWITTAKGSAMPLSVATIEERGGGRYALSHFSDCPEAKGWSWSKKSR